MKNWLTLVLVAATAFAQAQAQVVSADGRWRFVAEDGALAIFSTEDGQRARRLPTRALDGRGPGQVRELHVLPARRSVVVVFDAGLDELWEVSTDPQAEPIYDGLVHDHRMAEALATPGFLNPRRTRLDAPLRELRFARNPAWVQGRAPDRVDATGSARAVFQLWQLDVRRRISEQVLDTPAPAGALPWAAYGDW